MADPIAAVRKALDTAGFNSVDVSERRGALVLEGSLNSWESCVKAGYTAAGRGFRGLVNNLVVPGLKEDCFGSVPSFRDKLLEGASFDVVVIGGGIIGSAIARELTRWSLRIALLEKEDDLAKHASGRNNGMVHPAMAVKLGSKKHHYNLRGNHAYNRVAKELDFEIRWPGSLALLSKPWEILLGPLGRKKATAKGVLGFEAISAKKVKNLEPNVFSGQKGAFVLPETGVVNPYKVTAAYAENAVQNGASIYFNTLASGFELEPGRIVKVKTNRGNLHAKVVVNAAGAWADRVAELGGDCFFSIHPRKGAIAILDKKKGGSQNYVFGRLQLSGGSHTKGGGLTPLLDGNILAGPTAAEVPGREDYSTSAEDLETIVNNHLVLNKALSRGDIITYFAGIRACTYEEDFIIEASEYVENLIHVAGIQSPGLASAPALAEDAAKIALSILGKAMELKPNLAFNPVRKNTPAPAGLSMAEKNILFQNNTSYSKIVCRCEMVSEGEIVDAIHSPVPARSMDALKRRVRVGMGRCQGGFCTPSVLNLLAEGTGRDITAICKNEPGSELIKAKLKQAGNI